MLGADRGDTGFGAKVGAYSSVGRRVLDRALAAINSEAGAVATKTAIGGTSGTAVLLVAHATVAGQSNPADVYGIGYQVPPVAQLGSTKWFGGAGYALTPLIREAPVCCDKRTLVVDKPDKSEQFGHRRSLDVPYLTRSDAGLSGP